jgi:hypothetical protein
MKKLLASTKNNKQTAAWIETPFPSLLQSAEDERRRELNAATWCTCGENMGGRPRWKGEHLKGCPASAGPRIDPRTA